VIINIILFLFCFIIIIIFSFTPGLKHTVYLLVPTGLPLRIPELPIITKCTNVLFVGLMQCAA